MTKIKYPFRSVAELDKLILSYFDESGLEDQVAQSSKKQPVPPTMSGLAYHLGFESIQAFEACEAKSRYTSRLKRARLRVEAEYEKKLHFQSSTGAIFALKSMGWNERINNNQVDDQTHNTLQIEVVNSGPHIAGEEKDVLL